MLRPLSNDAAMAILTAFVSETIAQHGRGDVRAVLGALVKDYGSHGLLDAANQLRTQLALQAIRHHLPPMLDPNVIPSPENGFGYGSIAELGKLTPEERIAAFNLHEHHAAEAAKAVQQAKDDAAETAARPKGWDDWTPNMRNVWHAKYQLEKMEADAKAARLAESRKMAA